MPSRLFLKVDEKSKVQAAERLTLDAVLLAAGRSSRMGRDKACLSFPDGRLLWRRQRSLLEEAGARTIFLSVRTDQEWAAGYSHCVDDRIQGAGPLAGIVAALERSEATHLIVLAVDLPRLPLEWLTSLVALCRTSTGACGCREDGAFEPLASVIPTAWKSEWLSALIRGERSLQRLFTQARQEGVLAVRLLRETEKSWLHNVNRPEDVTR
ncbi:MAG: molybdenum cofactor guanylyltransferase [Opitutaceae bacterium]|nr:molybdenum cofactor guanylyltransferase [Opitutaceae bacterium]